MTLRGRVTVQCVVQSPNERRENSGGKNPMSTTVKMRPAMALASVWMMKIVNDDNGCKIVAGELEILANTFAVFAVFMLELG